MTEADIKAIVAAVKQDHACRYSIDPVEMREAITFFRNFNKLMEDSGRTIWKTLLVLSTGGFLGLIGLGVVAKIKGWV